jgi:hypothetical protein
MTRDEFAHLLRKLHDAEDEVYTQGSKEYAAEDDAFHNFDTVGEIVRCPHCAKPIGPLVVAMVYFLKHVFGVLAWVGGHRSQREDVQGRIKDARLYLGLTAAMADRESIVARDEERESAERITSEIARASNKAWSKIAPMPRLPRIGEDV